MYMIVFIDSVVTNAESGLLGFNT